MKSFLSREPPPSLNSLNYRYVLPSTALSFMLSKIQSIPCFTWCFQCRKGEMSQWPVLIAWISTELKASSFFSVHQADDFVVVVQLLSHVLLWNPMNGSMQTSLSFTVSLSLLKLMSIKLEMPSHHLILCHFFLLLPSVFPSIRVFSSELALPIK